MIRVGTRGSALALAQARWVAERIEEQTEIIEVTTAGDRDAARADKSRWVSELERALLDDRIDIAVHSAKDVPSELPDELELVAIPERADPRDAICGARSLTELKSGARIGTSSLRRQGQLRALRDDLEIVDLRGNVDTRLRKLAEGQYDALVLAMAGLQRLEREREAGGVLDELVPAAGQGALAIEARRGKAGRELARLSDEPTTACVSAERELTRRLGASCNTPVGAIARTTSGPGDGLAADEQEIELHAWIGHPDGSVWMSDRLRGRPEGLGVAVAERMLSAGAERVLRQEAFRT